MGKWLHSSRAWQRTQLLVGGSNRTVELQPVSVQQQTGINVAAGIAAIELQFVR